MKNLEDIIKKIDKHINEKDKIREKALRSSRDIIIGCRKAIQLLHRELIEEAKSHIKQASAKLTRLYDLTREYPDLFHAGFVGNAAQELAEAHCLYNIIRGKKLPDPDDIQTTYSSYLMGLCDVVGELRREALDFILEGEASKANNYLIYMDKIYDAIMSLDYPSALIPIKRKQDLVRSLIEKTRGELAIASCEQRIEDRTHEFCGLLDKVNVEKKVKKKEAMDIDIDKVW
ncbi:MAG: RNA-binding protein [Thermoplasmatales archaeon]|nr:MAG: RNA-binding protein [Thermoplasmatales archaeon]